MYIVWTETQGQTDFALDLCLRCGFKIENSREKSLRERPRHYYLWISSEKELWVWGDAKNYGSSKDEADKIIHRSRYNDDEKVITLSELKEILLPEPKVLTIKDLRPRQKFAYLTCIDQVNEYLGLWKGDYLTRTPTCSLGFDYPDTQVILKE
jgi:hypothetical protein